MPYTTGAIYNPTIGTLHANTVQVLFLNDSMNIPTNMEVQVFQWQGPTLDKIASGQDLFSINPQVLATRTYSINAATYFEIQIDYFSAVNTSVNCYALDSSGSIVQRVLQLELFIIDRLTVIP